MVRGKGSWLWDAEGTRYWDFVQGWAVNCLGHAPPAIRRALSCQSGQLINPSPGFLNEPQLELARALTLASGLGQAFFCSTGAEANEGAVKLARKWGQRHRSGAYKVITTHDSFHGRTLAMTAASGKAGWENLFAPMMPGFVKVPYGDAQAVYQTIDPATAAVMVEPIQGEAGVRVPPAGYLQALREMTSQHGILLIFDEVQTGIARTGTMFAYEQEGVRPDVLTLAKGLGGGLPLAALLASHATCCFEPGEQGGAFCGTPIMTLPQPIAADVVGWCREHGLLLNSPASSVLRFLPALNVQRREINAMATILIAALHALLPQNTTRK
jgi:acetylornithine/N-succinyldiaminopimelate aminotransferase